MAYGSVAVEAFEIELRGSRVSQTRGVDVRLERGAVGGDVVGDELAEKRPARGVRAQRRRIRLGVAAVAEPSGAAQRIEELLFRGERREIGKQARVRGRPDWRVDGPAGAGGRETMRMFHGGIVPPWDSSLTYPI